MPSFTEYFLAPAPPSHYTRTAREDPEAPPTEIETSSRQSESRPWPPNPFHWCWNNPGKTIVIMGGLTTFFVTGGLGGAALLGYFTTTSIQQRGATSSPDLPTHFNKPPASQPYELTSTPSQQYSSTSTAGTSQPIETSSTDKPEIPHPKQLHTVTEPHNQASTQAIQPPGTTQTLETQPEHQKKELLSKAQCHVEGKEGPDADSTTHICCPDNHDTNRPEVHWLSTRYKAVTLITSRGHPFTMDSFQNTPLECEVKPYGVAITEESIGLKMCSDTTPTHIIGKGFNKASMSEYCSGVSKGMVDFQPGENLPRHQYAECEWDHERPYQPTGHLCCEDENGKEFWFQNIRPGANATAKVIKPCPPPDNHEGNKKCTVNTETKNFDLIGGYPSMNSYCTENGFKRGPGDYRDLGRKDRVQFSP